MTENDRSSFYTLWIRACEPYGKNFVPSTDSLEYIFNLLSRFDFMEVMAALSAHSLNPDDGRFAPKPADIVRHIVGDSASIAQAAWTKLITAIERVGTYESIVFDDPLIMAVVRDMGGWLELNRMTNENLPFKQNEFVTRYRGFLNHPPASHPRYFVGLAEAENNRTGNKNSASPRLWGDHQKCLIVYEAGNEKVQKVAYLSDLKVKRQDFKLIESEHQATPGIQYREMIKHVRDN